MTARSVAPPPRSRRWVLTLLALGVLALGIGLIISLFSPAPVPSPADAAHLAAYPFILAAILLLTTRDSARLLHVRVFVDGLMGVAAAFAFSWYFILGPLFVQQVGRRTVTVTDAAYTLWDLLLFCCLLLLVFNLREGPLRSPFAILSSALAAIIVSDSLHAYGSLHPNAVAGGIPQLGWTLGALLLLGSIALLWRWSRESTGQSKDQGEPGAIPQVWRYLVPYLLVPAVVALMVYTAYNHGSEPLSLGVYLAGALLIELVLFHQILTYRDLMAHSSRSTRLANLAAADPITALPNHRTLVSTLDAELERCRRYGRPCTVLFLDLDHFKTLNDTFGHPAGDASLREFASVVRSALRTIDILGRWGGEEFLAILPETGLDAGVAVAERVRVAVGEHTFWAAGGSRLTCSIGVAEFPRDARRRGELIEAADQAMYTAKRLGRDQVRRSDEVEERSRDTEEAEGREEAAMHGTVEALVSLAAASGVSAEESAYRAVLAAKLASTLSLDPRETRRIELASRLLDIGMVTTAGPVLHKGGPLSDPEREAMRRHAEEGAAIVAKVPQLRSLAPVIGSHHEHWDGSGYPVGLAGESIPVAARILALTSVYAAMTSNRPYRPALPADEALEEVRRGGGTAFDPVMTMAFVRLLEGGGRTRRHA